jgi:hypothetical protein
MPDKIRVAHHGDEARRRKSRRSRITSEMAGPLRCPACRATVPPPVHQTSLRVAEVCLQLYLDGKDATATGVADLTDLDYRRVSFLLKRACEQQILARVRRTSLTGGWQWVYSPRPALVAFLQSARLADHAAARLGMTHPKKRPQASPDDAPVLIRPIHARVDPYDTVTLAARQSSSAAQ